MKKIFITMVAVLCCVQFADAQVKSAAAVKKNVESAEAAAANPKKAEKVATWVKLGNAYIDAYSNPIGEGWRGATRQELELVLDSEKPVSSDYVTVAGEDYVKEVYATKNYYFDDYGVLQIIEVTEPIYADALERAVDAFRKACEVDVNESKTKDIKKALTDISGKYKEGAFYSYMLGDLMGASQCFERAAAAAEQAPLCEVDSLSIYNAGFIACAAGNYEKALPYFEQSVQIGYDEGGEAYAKLGEIYNALGEAEKAMEILEAGFVKYPDNQAVLVGLIGLYVANNQDPEKLFAYIAQAKANEPNNPSLYYVEGDIYKNLGDKEKALAAYNEASTVNPQYEFGYIGAGLMFFNEAIDIRDAASNEEDDAKYNELVDQFYQSLVMSGEMFEKAFDVTVNAEVKEQLAEQLKSIYFQLREQDDKYMAAYEKYSSIVANGL